MLRSALLAAALLISGEAQPCEPWTASERAGGAPPRATRAARLVPSTPSPTVFLGDSLIAGWPEEQRRLVFPAGSVNAGVGGDGIQNLLHRIEVSLPPGSAYQNAVLLIGTNNLPAKTSDEILCGIEQAVRAVQGRAPGVKVFVLEIPPRGRQMERFRDRILAVNRGLAERLPRLGNVRLVPVFERLEQACAGTTDCPKYRDMLHFTKEGYEVLTEALRRAAGEE